MLTEEDKDMLRYFWEEKQDIESYYKFKEILPKLQEDYPEVIKAWNDYRVSIKILTAVLSNL